ncbi:MmgE/PrpD family protein [Paraburkholderia sp. B3]|uniref:MmgE/PrpD family protein n=1 Tax=Paraburkholderia sp. B3 TaxID=3134791 RepID=UPI0039828239
MHSPAAHSDVSEALTKLAVSTPGTHALDAARSAIAQAWLQVGSTHESDTALRALSEGNLNDARLSAWEIGTTLASHSEPQVATPVVGAAMAMGLRIQASEDDIAAAVAVGTQAAERLLAAVDSEGFRARWNVASSLGILGATLAVSRLLGLDELRMRHALGIAATQAAGLARNVGQPMGALETGKAAADAVEASLLAKHGVTSAPASIDGRRGLAALMASRFDANAITANKEELS